MSYQSDKLVQARESLRITNAERKVNIARVVSLGDGTDKGIYRINHPETIVRRCSRNSASH
jgi:hypothetical protein